MSRWERAASLAAGLVVLAFVADVIPPWPFVHADGTPVDWRRLGMTRCQGCGHYSNAEHRDLCRGVKR